MYTSAIAARVQVKTSAGWTNYTGPNEFFRSDMCPISPHGHDGFVLDFPKAPVVWRFHVSYAMPAPTWMQPVRSLLKLQQERHLEAWSQEITNALAR